MASALNARHFQDEQAAYAYVEARLWPEGPVCPRCNSGKRIGELSGNTTRVGLYKCYKCRKPFTVKIGTVFESSHVPMRIWLQAMFLIAGSKKGISANQLHRILGVTLKTAWFLAHRIREAMREGDLAPFGSGGGIVEADETYIGNKPGVPVKKGNAHKMKVLALVDRSTGKSRAFVIDKVAPSAINPILHRNLSYEARLFTDELPFYNLAGAARAEHQTVNHRRGEYGRGEVYTNTIEGYFSILKRGMRGIYQWCAEKHLHRYLAEYDFRYSHRAALGIDDTARADNILRGVVGKRLTYQTASAR